VQRCRRFFSFPPTQTFIQPLAVQREIADGGDMVSTWSLSLRPDVIG